MFLAVADAVLHEQHTHRTGFAVTDDILSKVIRRAFSSFSSHSTTTDPRFAAVTVQNGLLTTLCAIAHLVSYLASSVTLPSSAAALLLT